MDEVTIAVDQINVDLLRQAPVEQLPGLIEQQTRLFEDSPFSESFTEGMIGALTELLKLHREIPAERLQQLRDRVIPQLATREEFSAACRLFDVGVRYIEAEDVKILLELPLEERSTLEKILTSEDQG